MFSFFLFFLFFAAVLHGQDNIILPDIELSIGDQSSVQTSETADALLKDRNPIFEQVYLEELGGASNRTQNTAASYRYRSPSQDLTLFRFAYGYYHQIDTYAEFQRKAGSVLYNIRYGGFSRQYAQDSAFYPEAQSLTNGVSLKLSGGKDTLLWEASLAYEQDKTGFIGGQGRLAHHIPFSFQGKRWINASSFLTVNLGAGFLIQDLQQYEASQRTLNISDSFFSLAYSHAFRPWLNFQIKAATELNTYNYQSLDHSTLLTLLTEFTLPAGFSLITGFTLAPHNRFYGWPELALRYTYFEYLQLNLSFSGDFNTYSAQEAFGQTQVFSPTPALESRMALRFSLSTLPHPYVRFGSHIQLNIWRSRRVFTYNDAFYEVIEAGAHQSFEAGAYITVSTPNILELSLTYTFEHPSQTFLLTPAHKVAASLGLGWQPAGFLFETIFTFHSPREMGGRANPLLLLWDFNISQRVSRNASLFVVFKNILNTDAYFWTDIPYGGFQVRGGFRLSF